MSYSIKEYFWEKFNTNLKLNYFIILKSLNTKIDVSNLLVNSFHSNEKQCCEFYMKISELLLKEENIVNDLSMLFDAKNNVYKVYSINLCNFMDLAETDFIYDSFEKVHSSKYNSELNNINNDFSYLLANFVRFNNNKKFYINDNEKLHILSSVLEKFCFENDYIKLKILNSIDGSFIKLSNDNLIEKFNLSYKDIMSH